MKRVISILFLCVVTVPMTVAQTPPQPSPGSKIVTAVQTSSNRKRNTPARNWVNGTWRTKHGEFKLWALRDQKLRVEFSGVYEYRSPQGPMANTGEGSGIAHIEGDTVIFKPDVSEDECAITMKFLGGRLRVSQVGICGFGHNVTADGDYRRVSRTKPKFREP